MFVIDARNVNYALSFGVDLIHRVGVREDSRNGGVLRAPMPVTTVYERPCERVLFHDWRDANPFFHLVEAAWMIAGRNDLKALTPYVARMKEYSDDGGVTQPGAYGKRWRRWFDYNISVKFDQLDWVVRRLRDNPNDRRVVIQMWDPEDDPKAADLGSADVPCNLTALPWVSDGKLHLTVFCRSNDMMWGAYGANAVHFSFLLEYLAGRVGLAVGSYTQVSNNFHAYLDTAGDPQACWTDWPGGVDPYTYGTVAPQSMWGGDWMWPYSTVSVDDPDRVLKEDLAVFFEHGAREAVTKARWPFMRQVLAPMALAHQHWKGQKGRDRYEGALDILDQVTATDWRLAAKEWIMRRYLKAFPEARGERS